MRCYSCISIFSFILVISVSVCLAVLKSHQIVLCVEDRHPPFGLILLCETDVAYLPKLQFKSRFSDNCVTFC